MRQKALLMHIHHLIQSHQYKHHNHKAHLVGFHLLVDIIHHLLEIHQLEHYPFMGTHHHLKFRQLKPYHLIDIHHLSEVFHRKHHLLKVHQPKYRIINYRHPLPFWGSPSETTTFQRHSPPSKPTISNAIFSRSANPNTTPPHLLKVHSSEHHQLTCI